MIQNAYDMYEALLLAVNKEETSTIYPDQAILLLNEAAIIWIKENSKLVEINQRSIDDLQDVRQTIHDLASNVVGFPNRYNMDAMTGALKYFQLLNVSVRITTNDPCLNATDFYPVRILRSDRRNVVYTNPYRKPAETKLYYDIKQSILEVYGAVVNRFHIEYLSYLIEITDVSSATPTDMSEYAPYILQEVVDVATRIYLERTENPRYRSIVNEEAIKRQGQ